MFTFRATYITAFFSPLFSHVAKKLFFFPNVAECFVKFMYIVRINAQGNAPVPVILVDVCAFE